MPGRAELRACCVSLLCFPLMAAALSFPQQSTESRNKDYALIYGTVWGPGDRPVAGIPIRIRKALDKKAKWQLTSGRRGEFAQRVPVGAQDYIIEAAVKMPKGQPRPQVMVHIDDNERKDVSLHLSEEELSPR